MEINKIQLEDFDFVVKNLEIHKIHQTNKNGNTYLQVTSSMEMTEQIFRKTARIIIKL